MDNQPTEVEQARPSRQIVLQAITTICAHNAYANRASVTRLSGLSQVIVDDRLIVDVRARMLYAPGSPSTHFTITTLERNQPCPD